MQLVSPWGPRPVPSSRGVQMMRLRRFNRSDRGTWRRERVRERSRSGTMSPNLVAMGLRAAVRGIDGRSMTYDRVPTTLRRSRAPIGFGPARASRPFSGRADSARRAAPGSSWQAATWGKGRSCPCRSRTRRWRTRCCRFGASCVRTRTSARTPRGRPMLADDASTRVRAPDRGPDTCQGNDPYL